MTEDDQNRLLRGYEQMLRRLREMMDQPDALTRPRLTEALETAQAEAVEGGNLTDEEAGRIGAYLRRDLEEAASYAAEPEQDVAGWLRMDLRLIEEWLWDLFASVADQTKLELMQFQQQIAPPAIYRAGEISGPGALRCTHCGHLLELKTTSHLPPCPACLRTKYQRAGRGGD